MKKSITLFLAFLCLLASAQEKPKRQKRKIQGRDWIAIDITSNLWLNTPQGIQQKHLHSLGYNLTVFRDWPIKNTGLAFALGISYSVERVAHNGKIISNFTNTALTPLLTPYKSNKLTTEWFDIPVELRMRSKGKGPFRFYLGAKAGFSVTNYQQFIDANVKIREYRIKHLHWYRYGVHARLGYGYLNVFAYYSLSDLFVPNKGPAVVPVSVGLCLLLD